MTVLFSLPVHEHNHVVRDTIENAKRYNPDSVFVLHVSAAFSDFDFSIGEQDGVLINPVRFHTVHAHSQVPTHITNYIHAYNCGVDFSHLAVLHTSEMFVKKGMSDYIDNLDYSIWFTDATQPRVGVWPPWVQSFNNKVFKTLFDPYDPSYYLGNLIEGSFYRRELFHKIAEWTVNNYDVMNMLWPYAAEEVYFPTLANFFGGGKRFGHPYCCFHHKTHYVDNTQDVDDIRANRMVTFWQPNNFVYNKIPFPSLNLYSIKRISRDANDPIRHYINSLPL
jgi:hypothetical protein